MNLKKYLRIWKSIYKLEKILHDFKEYFIDSWFMQ